ncbi:MAG TPA: restriction endonuclease fold toxin-2 domain-containing protein [Myxococcaceae bacterium]|nr:restriction endonuclease fold toxin-2 domain-containing protein [Myxococcaceae bacterium]
MLLEAKYVGDVERSPFVPGSKLPPDVRAQVRVRELAQLKRYAAVIRDPSTPAVGLEIITNEPGAVGYFEELMQEAEVPGRVVVKP